MRLLLNLNDKEKEILKQKANSLGLTMTALVKLLIRAVDGLEIRIITRKEEEEEEDNE